MTQEFVTHQDPRQSTRVLLVGIWSYLNRRRRAQFFLMLIVMLTSGVAEILSLGAIFPFIAVLSDPQRLWQQPIVQKVSISVGLESATQLILPATLLFVVAVVLAAVVRLTNLWLNGRLAAAIGSDLSCEAYRRTLYQPYSVHVQRNSSAVIAAMTSHIGATVNALNHLLKLITSAAAAVWLLIGLLVIDAPVALGAAAFFGTSYGLLGMQTRRQLRSNGQNIADATSKQVKVVQEGLGAIRDVLLDGSQSIYLQTYQQADRPKRQLLAKNNFLATFPRYALEAIGLVGIAFLGRLLILQRGSGTAVIPLLGTLALGAQRLLPALQQVYSSWSSLNANNPHIKAVLSMLSQPMSPQIHVTQSLLLTHSICLDSVHFSYSKDQTKVLNNLDLRIRCGERIGIIGSTGSGKSTTIDILMGLLEPTSGRVLVDGLDLHDPENPERLLAWRASIAHVPQSIYLADSTIAENIAFGVPLPEINMDRVKRAAEQAQIASYIESSPKNYETPVGERGIRLSGGQRQRIGIARALYRQARVLVLDEATSALDTRTEEEVMAGIDSLNQSLTVIMIAHRLSTVEHCDRVIRLVQGSVSDDGPPQLILA